MCLRVDVAVHEAIRRVLGRFDARSDQPPADTEPAPEDERVPVP